MNMIHLTNYSNIHKYNKNNKGFESFIHEQLLYKNSLNEKFNNTDKHGGWNSRFQPKQNQKWCKQNEVVDHQRSLLPPILLIYMKQCEQFNFPNLLKFYFNNNNFKNLFFLSQFFRYCKMCDIL